MVAIKEETGDAKASGEVTSDDGGDDDDRWRWLGESGRLSSCSREQGEPNSKQQQHPTETLASTHFAQLAQFTGPVAWNQGGWSLTPNYY